MLYPICFTSRADYERWRSTKGAAVTYPYAHCADCLPSYQFRMKRLGRCERPQTMFSFAEDGIVGLVHG